MAIRVAGIIWFRAVNEYRSTVPMDDWVVTRILVFLGFTCVKGTKGSMRLFGSVGRVVEFYLNSKF